MRCVFETFPDHTVYHLLGFSCMFSTKEDALEPGDFGPMGWVPCSITLKGLRWLTQPHQTFSAPRVSTLMSQSAVGLDMVNPGCITAPERIL